MQNRPPHYTSSADQAERFLAPNEFARYAESWLLDCEVRQLSDRTLEMRKMVTARFSAWLTTRRVEFIDATTIRLYLRDIGTGPRGKVSNSTIATYHRHLRALMNWIVEEGGVDASPMLRVKPPIVREDQPQPFTPEEMRQLLAAARKSRHPRRDEAVCLMLLDTGLRASELVGLTMQDVDLTGRRARVLGKGNKERSVSYNSHCARALLAYVREGRRDPSGVLFLGEQGPLSRSGLLQLIERLGTTAGVEGAHPHRFRHTFAIEFLRAGGNVFTLQQILGHTALRMTQRYVALAQADIEVQHRRCSPVERLLGKER